MMTHLVMISLIGDLFMDAYIAGQQTDMSSIQRARADRDRLLHEVRELYRALDDSEEQINDQKRELEYERSYLKKYGTESPDIRDICDMYPIMDVKQEDWKRASDILHGHDIPDDGDRFSEQDLSFPDVEDPDEYLKREV